MQRLYGAEGRLFMRENLNRNGGADVARAGGLVFDMAAEMGHQDLLRAYASRTKFARLWSVLLDQWPVIICPNSGALPFLVGLDFEGPTQTERMMRALAWQIVPPLIGVPGLSVPLELIVGLPCGVQILSQRFREDLCLAAGSMLETGFDFAATAARMLA